MSHTRSLPRLHGNGHALAFLLLAASFTLLLWVPNDKNLARPPAGKPPPGNGPYPGWKRGPSQRADYFPLAVWLQAPRDAPCYQALGINLYVGLWRGPNEEQLAELKKHGMPVICALNAFARARLDEPTFVGWMHGDEPDNAQPLGKGYGPPIPPETVEAAYARIRATDSTRPVLLNLGQGVAWDGWHGRGTRADHPEDYPKYLRGCDLVSFDIYTAVHSNRAVAGKL